MWNNSSEFLGYAAQEIIMAIMNNTQTVEIVLNKSFQGSTNEIWKFCNNLEIKEITGELRERFSNYEIKSLVSKKGHLLASICYLNAHCDLFYPLVWEMTLKKKAGILIQHD